MKSIMLTALLVGSTTVARAAEPPAAASAKTSEQARPGVKKELKLGKTFAIELPCNPTTGYEWELKSIDREIAVPTGPVEFKRRAAKRGMLGVGGTCVLGIKGVKPGTTTAVLVYRRSWEKDEPAETFTAEITVLPQKKP